MRIRPNYLLAGAAIIITVTAWATTSTTRDRFLALGQSMFDLPVGERSDLLMGCIYDRFVELYGKDAALEVIEVGESGGRPSPELTMQLSMVVWDGVCADKLLYPPSGG